MPISRASYSARPETVLGTRSPGSKAMRLGAEIETGWRSQHEFDRFHDALDARGLGDKVVSKPDASIASSLQAEIVTLPFAAATLRDVVGEIGDTLADVSHAPHVSIAGCGVHVHISKGPLTDLERARYMAAVMFDSNSWYNQGLEMPEDAIAQVAHLNKFWDLIALRESGSYRTRRSMSSRDLVRNTSHDYAAIIGNHTPTVELRIFKTCRSPKVLRSYPEVAASLIAFVKETGPKEEKGTQKTMTPEQWWAKNIYEFYSHGKFWCFWTDEVKEILNPVLVSQGHSANRGGAEVCSLGTCGRHKEHRAERGAALVAAGFDWGADTGAPFRGELRYEGTLRTMNNAMTANAIGEPIYGHYWSTCTSAQSMYLDGSRGVAERYYIMIPTEEERAMLQAANGSRSVPKLMWETGILPVKAYTDYILSNISLYPNLASRLELPRFVPFLEEMNASLPVDTFEFDRTQPHDDLGRGCRVYVQSYPEYVMTVKKFREGYYTCVSDSGEVKHHEEDLLHVCEGATRLEVWGE